MKSQQSSDYPDFFNIMVYSYPGGGKTKFGLDFPGVVMVDCGEKQATTAKARKINVPVLQPETYDDFRLIAQRPKDVLSWRFGEAVAAETKSFLFDSSTTMQQLLMGRSALEAIRKDSEVIVPAQEATGVMSYPRKIPARERPDVHDFGTLIEQFRDIMDGIREMPYHTIITAHAKIDRTENSPRGLNAKEDEIERAGFPMLFGDLKYHADGLVDYFLYLERNKAGQYIIHPVRTGTNFRARTRYAEVFDRQINWTDRNAFELLTQQLEGKK